MSGNSDEEKRVKKTHTLLTPWPITHSIRTWCGYRCSAHELEGQYLACEPEAVTCLACIRAMREANITGEVVLADNGSTDDSKQIAESLGARTIDVTERGYGAALMHGIEADVVDVTNDQIRAARRAYFANTSYFDANVGVVLKALEELDTGKK